MFPRGCIQARVLRHLGLFALRSADHESRDEHDPPGGDDLHLGNFQEAIDYLDKYSKKDKVIGSLAIGATGDAYVELGDLDKGVAKYVEAADYAKNSFNSPLYLMKAAEIYEMQNKYTDALNLYQRIQDEYPESTEGSTIEKYIARVKILIK